MRGIKWVLIMGVFPIFSGWAQPVVHSFSIDNHSDQHIYVWVTAANGVLVPGANKLPYQVADIGPNTLDKKIYFSYTQAWDTKTNLSLTFCSVNSESCLNTVGEYSSISIVPAKAHANSWRVNNIWSAIVFPSRIRDNIVELDNTTWNRDQNFPVTIVFSSAHKKHKY